MGWGWQVLPMWVLPEAALTDVPQTSDGPDGHRGSFLALVGKTASRSLFASNPVLQPVAATQPRSAPFHFQDGAGWSPQFPGPEALGGDPVL